MYWTVSTRTGTGHDLYTYTKHAQMIVHVLHTTDTGTSTCMYKYNSCLHFIYMPIKIFGRILVHC
jgi:hypothetical protein